MAWLAPLRRLRNPKAMIDLLRPDPVLLDSFTPIRREATRPMELRDESFARNFDDATLFFDAFHLRDREKIVVIGPPFLNLETALSTLRAVAEPSGAPCTIERRARDRQEQLWIDAPADTARLHFESALGAFDIAVGEDRSEAFKDRRALFTLSRNNRLEWICDWARYNRDVHGADAILFYDNASNAYPPEAICDALGALSGFKQISVVAWPFKYGPQGLRSGAYWDSDFCQLGAWEHMRWRFLRAARSVMNSDIDELVVTSGGRSIFDMAERSLFGVQRYYGRWIVGVDGLSPEQDAPRRHADYDRLLRATPARSRFFLPTDANLCQPKWTLVPQRCPENAQWGVHKVRGWAPSYLPTPFAQFRHFREIADNWKYDRAARAEFARIGSDKDKALAAAYAQVNWGA
jgi:hypothetical protein